MPNLVNLIGVENCHLYLCTTQPLIVWSQTANNLLQVLAKQLLDCAAMVVYESRVLAIKGT